MKPHTPLPRHMGLEYATIEGFPLQSAVTRYDPGYTGNENTDDPAVREKILNNAVVSLAGIADRC